MDIQESTPPFTPEQTQYLFYETSKARLFGYQDAEENLVGLYNSSGEAVGTLHLHTDEFLARFPKREAGSEVPADECEAGFPVDLVVICKVRTYAGIWNEERQIYDLPLTKKTTYAVLWVEWKDGVAYRLAIGWVEEGEWDKLGRETVSLVLG